MEPGRAVTLQDVAAAVGVHKTTVHRALRGDGRIEAGTAARVRAAARRLGYDANANLAARQLSLRKSGRHDPNRLVAMVLPVVFTRGPYFLRPYLGFMEAVCAEGHDVLTRILAGGPDEALPAPVLRGAVDAVVALAGEDWLLRQRRVLDQLPAAMRRPLIGLINPAPGGWHVGADFRQGGRLAMGHLLDLGHRRVIGIEGMSHRSRDRCDGYRDELRARGLDPAACLALDAGEPGRAELAGRLSDILDRLLTRMPDATALLAPNDEVAVILARLLEERGRPVPERMSLVGFDDTHALPGPGEANRLTTVALPLEQLGREAGYLAMAPGEAPRAVILPVSLRVRATTCPPA